MLKIAIIEDNKAEADRLREFLDRFSQQGSTTLCVDVFGEALSFLEHYKPVYDIVFMDIEMPYLDGMEAARRLREVDQKILLIFVTNMAQFAVKGYEVDALDYIVKPIQYQDFKQKFQRAVMRCRNDADAVLVAQQDRVSRILLRDICYIEVRGHRLIYHTEQGMADGGGTLRETEAQLRGKGFLRCNKCYLVNFRHIVTVRGSTLLMTGGDELTISRPRKKDFMRELAECMGNESLL